MRALRGGLMMLVVAVAWPPAPLPAQRKAAKLIVWPEPPQASRIRYLGSWNSEEDFGKKGSFFTRAFRTLSGSEGPSVARIRRPFDVLAAGNGRVYVTNALTPAVLEFDPEARAVRSLGADVPGGLARPTGLGGDDQGRVYVADAGRRLVVVFGPDGQFLRAFGGPGLLLNPQDVAVDGAAGLFYVTDSYCHQVLVFDERGELLRRLGKTVRSLVAAAGPTASDLAVSEPAASAPPVSEPRPDSPAPGPAIEYAERSDLWQNRGTGPAEFDFPFAVAVGRDGRVYVTDQMNFRVQVFDRDGRWTRSIGSIGTGPGFFARPKGVAVDRENHLYVADAAFNNVQVFDEKGQLLIYFGGLGSGDGELWLPMGISVGPADRIYVADRYNHRAQVFQYLPAPGGAGGGDAEP